MATTKTTKKEELNMEDLMKTIQSLQSEITSLKEEKKEKEAISSPVIIKQNEDITRLVKVTSLLDNIFNLSTERRGKGKIFTFSKFGEVKNIKFTDLQSILEHHRKDFEKGYAILSSKKDYDDLQIGYIYNESLLNFEKMKDVICLKDDSSVDIILNMDEDMQDNIINLIASKIVNENYSYDYNKIKRLENEGFEIDTVVEMLKQKK